MPYVRVCVQNVVPVHVSEVTVGAVSVLMHGRVGVYRHRYLPRCVHTSPLYRVSALVYAWSWLCVFAHLLCVYTPLCRWGLHRCGVGLVCLCAHVCAGAGKRVPPEI